MQINVLATNQAPDYYSFNGEVITAHHNGISEVYNLSGFPEDGRFTGAGQVNGVTAIRNVTRTNGELKVTLCQQTGTDGGYFKASGWKDASSYDPDYPQILLDYTRSFTGTAWVKTRRGEVSPNGELVA